MISSVSPSKDCWYNRADNHAGPNVSGIFLMYFSVFT